MRSSRKATITFVAILLLFLLSFVSAELNKRDPQAPGDGGGGGGGGAAPPQDPPAKDPPAGGKAPGDAPAAPGGNPPGGNPPGGNPPGGNPPGGNPPGGNPPGGNPPGGNPPGGNPPGGNPPGGNPPGGNPPGDNPPGGNPPGGNPPGGNPPGGNPPGGNPPGGNPQADNSTTPKYIDPLTPTVQVKVLEPKSSKNILFKIGAKIKFRWEYSDKFLDPPKYITVAAQPTVNTKTNYTIVQNMTLNDTQEVIWDTSTQPALPMSQYKLLICDQDGMNAPPKPGGLQPFSSLQFGLYTPQDTSSVCDNAGCSSAIISIPIITLPTIGLALITIISLSFILI